jgi:hypothetical protein
MTMNQLSRISHVLFSDILPHSAPLTLARLGYVGECTAGLRTAQLMSLYFDSYQRAMYNGLRGMFICDGEKLGGVIEGDHSAVNKVWMMIQNDNRNHNIHLFEQNEISTPIYDGWTMHVKDSFILNLMYPQCNCPIRDTDNSTTEEVLGMMHSYANYLRQTN